MHKPLHARVQAPEHCELRGHDPKRFDDHDVWLEGKGFSVDAVVVNHLHDLGVNAMLNQGLSHKASGVEQAGTFTHDGVAARALVLLADEQYLLCGSHDRKVKSANEIGLLFVVEASCV